MFDPTLFDASRLSAPAAAFVDAVTELAGRPSEAGPVDSCGLTVTRPGDEETLNEVKALAFAFKAAAALPGERLLDVAEPNLTVLEGRATVTSWASAELLMPPGRCACSTALSAGRSPAGRPDASGRGATCRGSRPTTSSASRTAAAPM